MSRRNALVVLLLTATLPLTALALLFLRAGYSETRARLEDEQLALARAGAIATQSFLSDNVRTLQTLSVELERADRASADALQDRLAKYVAANPRWNGMSIVGSDLRVIVGAQAASRGLSLADRPYLRELAATGRPAVSDGLLPSVVRVPSVIVAVPLRMSDGSSGALLASVGVDDLAAELRQLITSDASRQLSVIDHAGQRLVQPTGAEGPPLEQIGGTPPVVAAKAGHEGVMEVDRSGENRLVGYVPLAQYGWVVTASEPASTALGPARRFLWQGLAIIGLSLAGMLIAGAIVGERLRRLYETTARARQHAEEAIRTRDEFLSVASHELRNPVAGIKGIAQLLQRRLSRGTLSDQDLREYIDEISESSTHLGRLVEDLLNVSRLQGGRFDLRLEEADILEVLARAVAEAVHDHPLEIETSSASVMALMDTDRIRQVLVNLLDNATKYSPPGSPIRIVVTTTDDEVDIQVIDQGIGLPHDDSSDVFAPFGRASNALNANIPGLGLGLYLSRQLAEAHGGRLTAASGGEGRGSTFTLTLPAPRPAEPGDASDGAGDPAAQAELVSSLSAE